MTGDKLQPVTSERVTINVQDVRKIMPKLVHSPKLGIIYKGKVTANAFLKFLHCHVTL